MDKSDLEDGEVTSSDAEELPSSTPSLSKSTIGGDVIEINSDSAFTVIEIPSDATPPPPPTGKQSLLSRSGNGGGVSVGGGGGAGSGKASGHNSDADDGAASSRTATKRRNRKLRKAEIDSAKKAKTEAQIKQLEAAEMDEYEMLCVRGASPPRSRPEDGGRYRYANDGGRAGSDDDDDSDADPSSAYYRSTPAERREQRREQVATRRSRNRRNSSTDERASGREEGGGGGGGGYRAEYRQSRKLELCKFFLTGKCAKSLHCTYLHEDFPCKYYYLGIPHNEEECMFAHGAPLEPAWQGALLKHIERAPVQILGKFPKAYKANAAKMMRATHDRMVASAAEETAAKAAKTAKTAEKSSAKASRSSARSDENGSGKRSHKHRKHHEHDEPRTEIEPTDESGRWSPSGKLRAIAETPGARPSTPPPQPPQPQDSVHWSGNLRIVPAPPQPPQPTQPPPPLLPNPPPPPAPPPPTPLAIPSAAASKPAGGRRVDFMADILNAEQLGRLRQLGIEYLEQVNNLTVAQLNEIGLSIAQIHQIQMCSLNAAAAATAPAFVGAPPPVHGNGNGSVGVVGGTVNGDVDMRIPAMAVASTMQSYAPYVMKANVASGVGATNAAAAVAAQQRQQSMLAYAMPVRPLLAMATRSRVSSSDDYDDAGDDDDDTDGQLVINDDDGDDPDNNA